MKDCRKQCDGCAFKKGTNANQEIVSVFTAQLAVMTPSPFYCHSTMKDWKNAKPEMSVDEKREAIKNGLTVCEGWKNRVKELAETGYYKNSDVRENGVTALNALNLYKRNKLPNDLKKQCLEVMSKNARIMFERVKQFKAEFIVAVKEKLK